MVFKLGEAGFRQNLAFVLECLTIESIEYLSLDVKGTVVYVGLDLAGEIRL